MTRIDQILTQLTVLEEVARSREIHVDVTDNIAKSGGIPDGDLERLWFAVFREVQPMTAAAFTLVQQLIPLTQALAREVESLTEEVKELRQG